LANPQGQSRWQLLQKAGRQEPPVAVGSSELESVSADLVAAYLDQQLSGDEARELESACWQSPAVLCELVSTYRFLKHGKPQAVAASLTNRLLQLVSSDSPDAAVEQPFDQPDDPSSPRVPANGHNVDWQSRLASVATAEPAAGKHGQAVRHPNKRNRRSKLFVWSYAVAFVFVVACIAGIALVLSEKGEDSVADPKTDDKQESPKEDRPKFKRHIVDQDDSKRQLPQNELPDEGTTKDENTEEFVDNESNSRKEPGSPDGSEPYEEQPNPKDNKQPELVPKPNPPARQLVKVAWDRIEGMVAARDESTGSFHGVIYHQQTGKTGSTFVTLPDSWAKSKIEDFGQMVLAADTQVSVTRKPADQSQLEVSLERGRLALHDLPIDRRVTVEVYNHSWQIHTSRPDSVVAVDLLAASPRIFVPEGQAIVEGRVVGLGKQMAWSDGNWTEPISLSRQENTSWTKRPATAARLNTSLQQRLLRSGDLVADLDAADGLNGRLATRWSLAIAPGNAFAQMSSPNSDVRIEAFRWILSLHPKDRRFTMALRQFVAKAGNPQLVRAMATLIRETRLGRVPDPAVAQQTLRGLQHAEIAVRHFAAFLLETTFRTKTSFQADAPKRVRDAQAALIAREVQQKYRAAGQRNGRAGGGAAQNNFPRAAQPQKPNRTNAVKPRAGRGR